MGVRLLDFTAVFNVLYIQGACAIFFAINHVILLVKKKKKKKLREIHINSKQVSHVFLEKYKFLYISETEGKGANYHSDTFDGEKCH